MTNKVIIGLSLFTLFVVPEIQTQVSVLESPKLRPFFRAWRKSMYNFLDRTGTDEFALNYSRKVNKLQKEFSKDEQFFCDLKGPGARSAAVPDSVHKLTPGDIDIIGAMGDSLTAGNGIITSNILQIGIENRGISWSGGGQATWRQFFTLPNILKEYNPNLYGYALGDALPFERTTRFNVGELGAMSRDIPYMAKVLVRRMQNDPKVNLQRSWKLVTLMIGPNDFCSDICYQKPPAKIIDLHERHLLSALRTIRDNLPRTMVNVVTSPDVSTLVRMRGRPLECVSILRFECPCMFGDQFKKQRRLYPAILSAWQRRQSDVVYRAEFQNRTDFAVNVQTFSENVEFPTLPNGDADFTYLSADCFHFSQKGNALAANALWNNMLQPFGNKSYEWAKEFENVQCPTVERPYLATLENSIRFH